MDERFLRDLHEDGVALIPGVIDDSEADRLIEALGETPPALRNLMEAVPEIAALARSEAVRRLAEAVLGPGCFAVRGLFFDKTPGANWKVAWHQDLTIAVRARRDVAGFGPWSEKAGVAHVQPPAGLLARMLTLRLHLDACGPENGPLRVVPGSHAAGRLDAEGIAEWRGRHAERVLAVGRGGAVAMRPLVLHASSPSERPRHRRVVHLEFAAEELPGGLEWHGRW